MHENISLKSQLYFAVIKDFFVESFAKEFSLRQYGNPEITGLSLKLPTKDYASDKNKKKVEAHVEHAL